MLICSVILYKYVDNTIIYSYQIGIALTVNLQFRKGKSVGVPVIVPSSSSHCV
jgi:hypothetical protein